MPRHLRFQVFLFTLIRVIIHTSFRMVYPFLNVFAVGMGVNLSAVTLAVTARSFGGVFGPFLASVADSRGRKAGMIFGIILYTIGVTLVVFWPVFPAFFIAMLLTGSGIYVFIPSMQAYLGDQIPYEKRGFTMSITEVSWSIAFMAGIPLVGFLISRQGWFAPFPLFAVMGGIAILALIKVLPNDPTPAQNSENIFKNLRKVLTYPPALFAFVFSLLLACGNEVVNLVFGIWMQDSFGLKIAALGAASALIGISELGGSSFSAAFVDRIGKKRAIQIGLVGIFLAALSLPVFGRQVGGAMAGLFFFYICYEFTLVSSFPLMSEVMPATRATMLAVDSAAIMLGSGIGALMATPLYHLGILGCTAASAVLNGLAFIAIWQVKIASES